MRRRKFMQGLLTVPAVPAIMEAAQTPPPAAAAQQQPQPQPNTPARQISRQPQEIPTLELTAPDLAAEAETPYFFSAVQFGTIQKLGALLVPPLKNNPGAMDAKAPEFLDFLIGVSPAERQKSYLFGLDQLELQAQEKYRKSFAELEATEADAIVRPLLMARPWPADLPEDPLKSFMAEVHEDLRTATVNSREWSAASEKSGRRFNRGYRGSGYYWFPIDPVS